MNSKQTAFALVILSSAVGSSAALGHHSYAPEFGASEVSYVEGVILEKAWESPHVSYQMEVTGGMPQEFDILHLKTQAPVIMTRRYNVEEDFLNVGDHVAIKGRNSALGNNGYQIISISINGGEEFALQRQGIPVVGELKEQAGGRDLSNYGLDGLPLEPEEGPAEDGGE